MASDEIAFPLVGPTRALWPFDALFRWVDLCVIREIEEGVHVIKISLNGITADEVGELSVDGRKLSNDVSDLACAPSGRLYALADSDYSGSNSLFVVDLFTGAMTRLQKFDVDRMLFVH